MPTVAPVLPLLLVALFVGVGVGVRSLVQLRRYGTSGIVMFKEPGVGKLRDLALVALPVLLFAQALAAWLTPTWLQALMLPVAGWQFRAWGAGLVVLATLLMLVAQLDMGRSWRVGIDRGARPGLVVSGAFRVCRNPIFACMLAVLLGCVLLVPTYLSLLLFVASWVGVRLQVAQEERFLLESYGAAYRRYARTTGRFVPGIGLLRD